MKPPGAPNLDVRLTRSQSGSILDIDFVGVMGLEQSANRSTDAAAIASANSALMNANFPLVAAAPSTAASSSTAVVSTGRRLKILEHRVHKVESRTKENGEQEEELVVSNLRPFTLKVGVHDHRDQPLADCSLPLRASLLYENGLPVRQTSTSEPLLVGETDVVALQGAATFKLRITSLSSHRDKQKFRIQVAPQDADVQFTEAGLCVVTDPMKSVTKLGRASAAAATPAPPLPMPPGTPADGLNGASAEGLKRKYRDALQEQAVQLQSVVATQTEILHELRSLVSLAQSGALRLPPPAGSGS